MQAHLAKSTVIMRLCFRKIYFFACKGNWIQILAIKSTTKFFRTDLIVTHIDLSKLIILLVHIDWD